MYTTITFTVTFFSAPVGSHTHNFEADPQNSTGSKTDTILIALADAFFTAHQEKMQATLSFSNDSVTLLKTDNNKFRDIFNEHSTKHSLLMAEESPVNLPATIKLVVLSDK